VPRHLYLFNPKSLTRLINKAGYKVVSTSYSDDAKYFIESFCRKYSITDSYLKKTARKLLKPLAFLVSLIGKSSVMEFRIKK
jgi:hypothetical protein